MPGQEQYRNVPVLVGIDLSPPQQLFSFYLRELPTLHSPYVSSHAVAIGDVVFAERVTSLSESPPANLQVSRIHPNRRSRQ